MASWEDPYWHTEDYPPKGWSGYFGYAILQAIVVFIAFIYTDVILKNTSGVAQLVLMCVFAVLALMMETSMLRAMLTYPPPIPERFYLTKAELDIIKQLESDANIDAEVILMAEKREILQRRILDGSGKSVVNICNKCSIVMPDRSFHCRSCGTCVLRLDHHCAVLNTCIHGNNYKFFILFLMYINILIVYILCTSTFARSGSAKDLALLFYIMCIICSLILLVVLPFFCYHLYLLSSNITHVEKMYNDKEFVVKGRSYNVSFCHNISSVMGFPLCCCIPIQSFSNYDWTKHNFKENNGASAVCKSPSPASPEEQ